jgi:hypothetical protein
MNLSERYYLYNVIDNYQKSALILIDRIPHIYDPKRKVIRYKNRKFVIRKFLCGNAKCSICGKQE